MRKIILFLIILTSAISVKAYNPDGLQVSLLTVMPRSNEVYTIYGHSALRLSLPEERFDMVYNWGTFDFSDSPSFVYRFMKGETDYFLSSSTFNSFVTYYTYANSTVKEQVLNLTAKEKEELILLIQQNQLPENIVYRYNFLFDNCTTRIRDIIEQATNNSLIYPPQQEKITFRDLIRSCTNPYPWMSFGIDLIIGNGADSLISTRQEMFLPAKLMESLDSSKIIQKDDSGNSTERSIVSSTTEISYSTRQILHSTIFLFNSPTYTGWFLLIICLAVVIAGRYKNQQFFGRGFFSLLFFTIGIAGSIVGFLVLFSTHPCVSPNWNILWLHPFHFIGFAGYLFKKSYSFITLYHSVNLLLLCFLLVSWHWLPQTFNTANIPYILCLVSASAFWLLNTKKKK